MVTFVVWGGNPKSPFHPLTRLWDGGGVRAGKGGGVMGMWSGVR